MEALPLILVVEFPLQFLGLAGIVAVQADFEARFKFSLASLTLFEFVLHNRQIQTDERVFYFPAPRFAARSKFRAAISKSLFFRATFPRHKGGVSA